MRTARGMAVHDTRRFPVGRQLLSVAEVAAKLEHRLYASEQSGRVLEDGCGFAIRHELPSVIALPDAVAILAPLLAGTSVGVVTIPGWRDSGVEPLPTKVLLAEAATLAEQGATDLGILANADRLTPENGQRFADDVSTLVAAMRTSNVRVRVILDTDGLTSRATADACELLGTTGVWLVQGGSWRGARTGLSRIQRMRAALPHDVRLKWTFPVRSLDSMLICIAEGVDLFNGDAPSLLRDAAERMASGPLTVPVKGVDY